MSAYRRQGERDEYPQEEEPVKETKKREPMPYWFWCVTVMVGSSVAIGALAEGCIRSGYQGVFGGLIAAAALVGIAGLIRLGAHYS